LNAVDTLPGFQDADTKIRVTGVIYKPDGVTPAEGVILYIYQTNKEGIYPSRGNEKDWAKRHGYIRGWMKTDHTGRYTFYTMKPGTYPSRSDAAHIHPTILEPDGRYYWVDEYLFEGDPLITPRQRSSEAPVGGTSGILKLKRVGRLWVGERNFILGRNVKGYSDE
jgi:protocatechuate 3,4-dioxygenase beta subunit